ADELGGGDLGHGAVDPAGAGGAATAKVGDPLAPERVGGVAGFVREGPAALDQQGGATVDEEGAFAGAAEGQRGGEAGVAGAEDDDIPDGIVYGAKGHRRSG